MTVEELLNRMSARELVSWQAYSMIEPFGEERADLRAGIIAATIANVNRKKGRKPYKPSDFMVEFAKYEKPKQDLGTLVRKLSALKASLGAGKKT
jgi:hypothetical protein